MVEPHTAMRLAPRARCIELKLLQPLSEECALAYFASDLLAILPVVCTPRGFAIVLDGHSRLFSLHKIWQIRGQIY